MNNKWYWAFKNVLIGPALRVWNRPWSEGMDKIPAEGPVILASSHQSVMDSFFLPVLCPREIIFLAKSEYFTNTGVVGAVQRWFFNSLRQVPVERTSASAADDMLAAARKILNRGDVFGIYPEGTRSPDGRVYKGRSGVGRVAMATGEVVVPIGMIGSRKANPIGTWVPRPFRVGMRVGDPIDPHQWAAQRGLDVTEHATARVFTDYLMQQLADLTGQPYVDVYGAEVKKALAQGKGYPEGAELS